MWITLGLLYFIMGCIVASQLLKEVIVEELSTRRVANYFALFLLCMLFALFWPFFCLYLFDIEKGD